MPLKIKIVAALVGFVAVLASLLLVAHTIDQRGFKRAEIECLNNALKSETETRKNIEKVQHEMESLDDHSIDLVLTGLGIMRRPEDR